MVETRSGRSVSPGESPRGGSPELDEPRKETAGTAGLEARAGPRSPKRSGRGGGGITAGPGGTTQLTHSQAYTLLALALGVISLPLVLTPKLSARFLFGSAADPTEGQHTHVLGLLASGMLACTAVAFALEECARRNMLHTFTADTLKLALAAFAASNILLQLWYPLTLTPWAAILTTVSQAALLALPFSQLFVSPEDRGRVWRDFRRLPHTLRSAVWLRKSTLPGALYLILTIAFPVAGLSYFFAPKTTLFHVLGYVYGKSTAMVWKGIGAGLLTVLPAISWTLKDKAENDLLARTLARTLNLGLMAASVGHLLVLGPLLNQGHGGWMMAPVTAIWGLALLASMAGLAAPEAAIMAEQMAEAARRE